MMKKNKIYLRLGIILGTIGILLWIAKSNEALAFFSVSALFFVLGKPKSLKERSYILFNIIAGFLILMIFFNGYNYTGVLIACLMAYSYLIDRPKTRKYLLETLKGVLNDNKSRS